MESGQRVIIESRAGRFMFRLLVNSQVVDSRNLCLSVWGESIIRKMGSTYVSMDTTSSVRGGGIGEETGEDERGAVSTLAMSTSIVFVMS